MTPSTSPKCRMLYILCAERSGSTMLSYMLAGSPRIIAPPELHIMVYPTLGECVSDFPESLKSLQAVINALQVDFPSGWQQMSPTEFCDWACSQAQSVCWLVDKTPRYARDIHTLCETNVNNPFYIWLLRHPLGVLSSQMERIPKRLSNHRLPYPLAAGKEWVATKLGYRQRKLLEYWLSVNQNIDHFLQGIPEKRRIHLHYEDLAAHPSDTLEMLCRKLNINICPGMLNPSANTPDSLGWGIGDEKIRSTKNVDPSRAFAWKGKFKESTLSARIVKHAISWNINISATPPVTDEDPQA